MEPIRLGGDVRLLRRRRRWSQARLATEAGVSRWAIVQIEAGRATTQRLETLLRVATTLGAFLSVRLLYRGEALDRLRDRRHAALVESMVARLRAMGWEVAAEVTFNAYGERGSIDILAIHPATRTLLVVEVKTVVPDLGGMLATLDRKVRLAAEIARGRGWNPRGVAQLVVLPETSSARRRVHEHEATFAASFPARNVAVHRWLRGPDGPMAGLLFLPEVRPDDIRREVRGRPSTAAASPRRRAG